MANLLSLSCSFSSSDCKEISGWNMKEGAEAERGEKDGDEEIAREEEEEEEGREGKEWDGGEGAGEWKGEGKGEEKW